MQEQPQGESKSVGEVAMSAQQEKEEPAPQPVQNLKGTALRKQSEGVTGARLVTSGNAAITPSAVSATTYPLTTTTGVALEDTTGATQLVASGQDDTASAVFNMGMDFWFNGVRYTTFSVQSNGLMRLGSTVVSTGFTNALASSTDNPKISPYWDDLTTGSNGYVRGLVTGTAPNRKLVIEWKTNTRVDGTSINAVTDKVFQVWLFETTGKIQFVYGAIPAGVSYSTGIVDAAAVFASVTTSTDTANYVTANDANATAIASGKSYSFTPVVPAKPTNLTFTAVTITSMTLNWTDNATNELGYVLYISTDNVNFSFLGQVAANSTSANVTGLNPSTTYFYQVYTVSEGALSQPALTGSQSTSAPSLMGTKTVCPAGCDYATLTAANTDIQSKGLAGALTLELQSTYVSTSETFPITFNRAPGTSATNTITVVPASNATNLTITSANTTATIDLNGGSNTIFDGRPGGTGTAKQLTIDNTATGGVTIRFINDATNDTVKYCTVKGVNTSTGSAGVIFFSTTTGANGNDNNTIDNCDIRDGATTPTNSIFSSGTTTTTATNNSGNTISNSNIFNFYNSTSTSNGGVGVNISTGTTDWNITGNSFYQTATRTTFGAASTVNAILISNASGNNFVITGNFIGGTASQCGGTAWTINSATTTIFRGIQATVGTTTATSLQGNTIQNISVTTTSASTAQSAFSLVTGSFNVGNVTGNTIGSQSTTGSITFSTSGSAAIFSAILAGNGTPGAINISNNTIGGIAVSSSGATGISVRGIGFQGAATSYTINNNIVGSTTTANSFTNSANSSLIGIFGSSTTTSPVNNITNNTVGNLNASGGGTSTQLIGILSQGSTGGAYNTTGNTVRNLSTNSTNTAATSGASVVGIDHTASTTAGQTVSQNVVHSLSNSAATAAVSVTAIFYSGPSSGTNIIERNFTHSLSTTSTGAAVINGIYDFNGSSTLRNNMVRLGVDASGNSLTSGALAINGILTDTLTSLTNNYYFNSVFIGGTGVGTGTAVTNAFKRIANETSDLRDNILVNARSNGAGTGKHYGINVAATTTLTSDYNDVYTPGTGGVFGIVNTTESATLTTWRTNTSKDANSISADPLFVNATGNSSAVDLHIQTSAAPVSPVSNAGITIGAVTNDFDNNTRLSPPDIGADEFTPSPTFNASGNLPSGTYDNVTINSPAVVTLTGNITVNNAIIVKNGATLNCGTFIVSGGGTFTLEAGGTLGVGDPNGVNTTGASGNIQVTGTRTYTAGGNYTYNGGAAQTTGDAMSNAPGNLTINNASGVTLNIASLTVNGTFTLSNGAFAVGANTLVLNSTVSATSGSLTSATGGTVNYNQGSNGQNVLAADYGTLSFSNFNKTLASSGTIGITTGFSPGSATGHTVTGSTIEYHLAGTTGSSTTVLPPLFTHYYNLKSNEPGNTVGPTGLVVDNTLEVVQGTFTSGSTYKDVLIDSGATLAAAGAISVAGDWTNNGSFTANTGTVTFNGTNNQSIGGSNSTTFATLAISNTGTSPTNVVSLAKNTTVGTALNITQGVLDQGTGASSSNLTTNAVTVSAGATLKNLGTGDLTLSGNVSNAGTITFNANGTPCGDTDDILIRSSVNGTQRSWSGGGTFSMKDVDVKDQAGTALIGVNSGTNSGNNGLNWVFISNCTSGAYTWSGTAGTDWNNSANWTPSRTPDLVGGGDVLYIDGSVTPSPMITNVPTQTIAALRLTNNAAPTLSTSGTNTLTMSGATGADLTVPAGSQLTLGGSGSSLTLSVGSGSTGTIGGLVLFQDGTHSLIGNAAGAITFQNGAICTTAPGTYNDNPFGTGASGDGTAGSVIFQSGSNYFHNAGQSPFGAAGNASVAVFQTGSTATWLTTSGFQANGRTYADLNIGKTDPSGVTVSVSDSGTGNFQFDNLQLVRDSSLTYNGSGASAITIQGNITSDGTGTPVNDLSLTAGTGGITLNKQGLQSFTANAAAKTITFGSDATVTSGTTLALNNRNLIMSPSTNAGPTLTVSGALSGGATGYVIGRVKKFFTGGETRTYEVGTANGYSPATITGSQGSGDATVIAFQTPQPRIGDTTKALQRYWTLTNNGLTNADLTFNYLDGDVPGTANENNFVIFKIDGQTVTMPGGSVNAGTNTASISNVTSFSDWTLAEPNAPTLVRLRSFKAVSDNGDVMLRWESGYEVDNLGYNIYRQVGSQARTRITPSMIAGSALLAGNRTVLTAGQTHTWFDKLPAGASGGVRYWLEDVDTNGKRTLRGPIMPVAGHVDRQQSAQALMLDQLAANQTTAQAGWPVSWNKQEVQLSRLPARTAGVLSRQRYLTNQSGVKISVRQAGWVRITQAELIAAGLDANVNPTRLQLFTDGAELAMAVSGNQTQLTSNDYIEFYAQGLDIPSSDTRAYYLVTGTTAGKRIPRLVSRTPIDGRTSPPSFDYVAERKERSIFFSGLDNGEAENFFGQVINTTGATSPLTVQHRDPAAASAKLSVTLQGVTAGAHQVNVQLNGTDVGTLNFTGREHPTAELTVSPSLLQEGQNNVRMVAAGGDTDVSLVDTLRLTYAHTYTADSNRLRLSVSTSAPITIDGFNSANIRVMDITAPNALRELVPEITGVRGGGAYTAKLQLSNASASNVRTLLAFVDNQVDHPLSINHDEPSSLATASNTADFLIITHHDFRQQVEPLAELRRSQGMQVMVVDVEDVYDEFSYGAHSPQAVRDFLTRAVQSWQLAPRYVLLVGDATYDPRNYLGQGSNDLVPTRMLYAGTLETASDDGLADINNDGVPELAVGRLPVRTSTEAETVINKIVNFTPNTAGTSALLIADRNDNENNFEGASQGVQGQLPSGMPISVINRGNQDTNTVHSQIISGINQGPLVVNYFGHGSVGLWSGSGLLSTSDVASMTNGGRLPLFTMMTCLNGYFHDVTGESLAEALLKAPQGGAIAVWASSGLTVSSSQSEMDEQAYGVIFATQGVPLGDAVRAAKAGTEDQTLRRTWIFFGDPTMRLR
jgi:hypothetical protein